MKKTVYILIALVTAGLVSSCDDRLDVSNPNLQSSGDFWQTEDQIAEGVIGIYNRLLTDGAFGRMTPSLLDLRGDDTWSESPWTVYPLTGDFTIWSSYDVLTWPWREYFIMVFRSNLMIEKAAGVEFENPDHGDRLVGQSYFLRAFTYYLLTENYERVPLILEVQRNADQYYPHTTSRDSILDQIEADLQTAMGLLPESYNAVNGPDQGQLGRATWGSAAGLLAKVYMIREKWTEAAQLLNEIITSGIYDLVDDYGENFTYDNENNVESLFEIQFGNYGTDDNWWNISTANWRQAHALGFNYGLIEFGAWGDVKPTQWLYDQFKIERTAGGTLDPRLYWTLVSYELEYDGYTDGRTNTVFGASPYTDGTYPKLNGDSIFIAKYTYARIPGHTQEQDGQMLNNIINYRFMRYAEILLLYAEALCELDRHAEAVPFINRIRERADLSLLEAGTMTDEQIWDELHHQRVLELSIEGVRHIDIKRWGWFYDADKLAELQMHDDEFETWRPGHEYLPIPSTELDQNPNLDGNSANESAATE
ncbi:MAG: RagB/SusD family nutrient uptake outer membrane protein [Bacteroidales bacterium]|nr:RagB/SusD family nutrient uptake outer membrane protein [Bacteroidales bacterium]